MRVVWDDAGVLIFMSARKKKRHMAIWERDIIGVGDITQSDLAGDGGKA
jgi:hypothetical protein